MRRVLRPEGSPAGPAWLGRFRDRGAALVEDLLRELRRLNRLGLSDSASQSPSRKDAARCVKAALRRDYRDFNRCC